ncbi:MAG: pilus assembly protein TadG-related protein [Candidatus Omnitrophota bacterium]|jgi:hypothetical protein
MFIFFAENRANYKKGQIFPFLIAIIVVIVIMAMITANLGKLAIFKTDVSNAADAGSLGGASVLSSFLLQIGLESDTWCANGIVLMARMASIFILGKDFTLPGISLNRALGLLWSNDLNLGPLWMFPNDLIAAIKLYVPYMIGFYFALEKAKLNGEMTWASAKQKALSSAFGNAGVDEGMNPRNKFKNYPFNALPGSYDRYLNVYMANEFNQSGFSRFMSHPVSGFAAAIGEIRPGSGSPQLITSGYGWSQNEDESFRGSYPGNIYKILNKPLYDNYVEVRVIGRSDYPFEPLTWSQFGLIPFVLPVAIYFGAFAKYLTHGLILLPFLGEIIAGIFAAIVTAFYTVVITTLPIGYTFPGRDMEKYTDKENISLKVTRYKKNTDMGIWNFQYGRVSAMSSGHTFVVNDSTIEPAFLAGLSFNTSKHLFETELTGVIK